jgi:hypothetical protein
MHAKSQSAEQIQSARRENREWRLATRPRRASGDRGSLLGGQQHAFRQPRLDVSIAPIPAIRASESGSGTATDARRSAQCILVAPSTLVLPSAEIIAGSLTGSAMLFPLRREPPL